MLMRWMRWIEMWCVILWNRYVRKQRGTHADLRPGMMLKFGSGEERRIVSVSNNTGLTIDAPLSRSTVRIPRR